MVQETRKDPRAKVLTMTVRYKSATVDEFIEHHSYDISRGGIFIKTPSPFPPGTLLKFEIKIADDKQLLQGVGRVVWKREAAQASNDRPAGMGVKFIKLDEGSRQIIDRLVSTKGEGQPSAFDQETAVEGGEPPPAAAPAPAAAGSHRKATMVGLGGVVPDVGAPASAPSANFFPASAGPPKQPPPEERTVMRQAAELLQEALKDAGGAPGDVAENPLFQSGKPPSTTDVGLADTILSSGKPAAEKPLSPVPPPSAEEEEAAPPPKSEKPVVEAKPAPKSEPAARKEEKPVESKRARSVPPPPEPPPPEQKGGSGKIMVVLGVLVAGAVGIWYVTKSPPVEPAPQPAVVKSAAPSATAPATTSAPTMEAAPSATAPSSSASAAASGSAAPAASGSAAPATSASAKGASSATPTDAKASGDKKEEKKAEEKKAEEKKAEEKPKAAEEKPKAAEEKPKAAEEKPKTEEKPKPKPKPAGGDDNPY